MDFFLFFRIAHKMSDHDTPRVERCSKGDRVKAKCTGWVHYHPGEITRVNDDGTYAIQFDDGERRSGVKEDQIAGGIEGDRVKAKCTGWVHYHPGEITRVNDDGTYAIQFDDGERRSGVKEDQIAGGIEGRACSRPKDSSWFNGEQKMIRPLGSTVGGALAVPAGVVGGLVGGVVGAATNWTATNFNTGHPGGNRIVGGVAGMGLGAMGSAVSADYAGRALMLPADAVIDATVNAPRRIKQTAMLGSMADGRAPQSGYRFGDFTRGLLRRGQMSREQHNSSGAVRGVSLQSEYHFGDLTRGLFSSITNRDVAEELERKRSALRFSGVAKGLLMLKRRGREAVDRVYAPGRGAAFQRAEQRWTSAMNGKQLFQEAHIDCAKMPDVRCCQTAEGQTEIFWRFPKGLLPEGRFESVDCEIGSDYPEE